MIKLIFCLRRLPSLSHQEFQRYWLEEHGPLVHSHREALGIKRYVQVHTDLGPTTERMGKFRGAPQPYDGVAELWFESREVLERSFVTPAMKAANEQLREDENQFIDSVGSSAFFTVEHVVIE